MVSKSIQSAQVKVEAFHFDMRKHLVEYDDVINTHREVIYDERDKVLAKTNLRPNIESMLGKEIQNILDFGCGTGDFLHKSQKIFKKGFGIELDRTRLQYSENKKIKSVNYNIDTYKKKVYVYGIAATDEERKEVIKEAKGILDVENVLTSIYLIEDLRVVKK